MIDRKKRDQGMNWIRPEKRLAIYLRDGLACCYCSEAVEDGAKLTLDHLRPYSKGGNNDATNLVTCCHRCNASRGSRSWKRFVIVVAEYLNHSVTGDQIVRHIDNARRRALDVTAAKEIMVKRGGFSESLKGRREVIS